MEKRVKRWKIWGDMEAAAGDGERDDQCRCQLDEGLSPLGDQKQRNKKRNWRQIIEKKSWTVQ